MRHRKLGMAAMVVLGTTAAYASSCLELLSKLICKEKAAMSLELRMKTSRFHLNLLPFPHLFTSFQYIFTYYDYFLRLLWKSRISTPRRS